MIDFSFTLPNLHHSFNAIPQFYVRSSEFNHFNLFDLLSQTLTASISMFSNKAKNSSNRSQLLQQTRESEKRDLQVENCPNLNLQAIFSQQKLEEKAIIQFQNSIQKSTQNIKEEQEAFKEQKIQSVWQLGEQASSTQKSDFVNFEIECPKIGMKIHEIADKKQRLMARKVTDWGKIIKKENKSAGYQKREIRMLFL